MGILYSICPFIKTDNIPSKQSIESIISEYFYLFNIYDRNPYIVREYMNFIDVNFDYAFSKLKYEIVSYEYPDRLDDNDSDIINYINDRYNLIGNNKLDICYRANKEDVKDLVTDRVVTICFNDYAYYDTGLLEYGMINDIDNEIPYKLFDEIRYIRDKYLRDTIITTLIEFMDYQSNIDYFESGASEYGSSDIISTPLVTLCQLRSFVNELLKERGDK